MKIILASKSPRRVEILNTHGISPIIMPTDTDETLPESIEMTEAVELLARRKGMACLEMLQDNGESGKYAGHLIISSDTIVWKDEIMGKPENREDAFRMLDKIRGTFHYVVTGVSLIDIDSGEAVVLSDVTKVFCKDYTDDDINKYLDIEEPYDKAGSYAIQGYFGRYIDHIEGEYETVVGLPFTRIAPYLAKYL